MAQPNVAREPSMEEILASIRKIIESNEPGIPPSLSGSLPPVYASSDDNDDIHLTVDDDFDVAELGDIPPVPEVHDPRFVAANSAGQPESVVARSTMSLADVAARVRAASERNAMQLNGGRDAAPSREMPPAMAARLAEVRLGSHAPRPSETMSTEAALMSAVSSEMAAQMSDVVVPMRPLEAPIADQPPLPASAARQPERTVAPQPVYAEPVAPRAAPMAPEQHDRFLPQLQEEAQKMLVSEATGEQVARSFDELAAALGAERRSLDDIAQDMLRPMLQEWLDDNLPTLVEKLVREEIERVARGPRR